MRVNNEFFCTDASIADDTCLAFKQYLENPQNTTLDDLLPCSDLASSDTQYTEIREALKNVISDATDQFLFYANGSTDLTGVCDPIGPPPEYKYTGICANDTLPISELSNVGVIDFHSIFFCFCEDFCLGTGRNDSAFRT